MQQEALPQESSSDLAQAIHRLADSIAASAGAELPPAESVEPAAEPFQINWDAAMDLIVLGKEKLLHYAPHLAAAAAVLLIGWLAARLVSRLLRRVLERAKVDGTLVSFFCSTAYMALMTFVIIAAIGQLGVNTASFVAILGAATWAIGFALQGSLSNFASGILMILFRPIRQGDLVEAGGVLGRVEEVGVFATIITTLENKKAIVSNGNIMGQNIINYTANGKLRVDMVFGIGYDDDMDKAMSIMREVVEADPRVLSDPKPRIACKEHGSSSVNFVCRPYVLPQHYWDVWFDTHQKVKEQFDAQGISIPFPQRDVHMIPAQS